MVSDKELTKAFSKAGSRARFGAYEPALMGKPLGGGSFTFDVPGYTGWVYVRVLRGNGATIAKALNSAELPQTGDLEIWVDTDAEGRMYVAGQRRKFTPLGSPGGGAGTAPDSAAYLVLTADGGLTSERVFVAGNGLSAADGGIGGNYTVGVNVDGSTIEISTDTLRVKDSGITAAKLADGAALAEILDNDGTGSLLDADLLDGQHASAFAALSHTHAAADVTSGMFDNARINWAAPSAIGSGTPAAGTFTALTGTTLAVNSASTSTVTAIVKATGSQTADLMQWQNSGGTVLASVLASGSAGFGAAALTTASLYGKRLPAVTSGTEYALIGEMRPNPSGTSSATYIGLRGVAQTIGANSNNITGAITGVSAQTSHIAAGTVTTAYGGNYGVSNSGSGEITSAYGAYFNVNNSSSGKIVNAYGLMIDIIEASGEITNAVGIQVQDILNAGTNTALLTNAGLVTFNEGGNANSDVRIEGDTDANLFFSDASADMVGIGTNVPAVKFDVNSDSIRVRTAKTPASAGDTGIAGQICWDANYLYVCTATNTWRRASIGSW